MATPPFTGDTSNPADNGIVSQFPTNERAHRDEIISYLDVEHDINTGYHAFQRLSTSAKNALTTPPAGMQVYDTTLGLMQINTGTSAAPVWTAVYAEATGTIKMWLLGPIPTGYLLLDGSAVSRTTYSGLFAIYGTAFGAGDGSTTFNLPNFQRRVPVGAGGTATSVLGNVVGNTGGEETHTLTAAESAVLTYTASTSGTASVSTDSRDASSNNSGGPVPVNSGETAPNRTLTFSGTISASTTVSSNAGGGAHNIMQPSIVVNFIVKT